MELDGKRMPWRAGGQPDYAYLRPEAERMTASWVPLHAYETGRTAARFAYPGKQAWPPPGTSVTLHFSPPEDGPAGVEVLVHYEMYDGIPLLAKWLTVRNGGGRAVALDRFTAETLAVVDAESRVEHIPLPPDVMHVETDYAFGGMDARGASAAVHWVADPQYSSQVNYRRESPVLLEVRPDMGPGVSIPAGGEWTSFRLRAGIRLHRPGTPRAGAPSHVPDDCSVGHAEPDPDARAAIGPDSVKLAIDQCAATGFEMVILSFGSGFNMEQETRRTCTDQVPGGLRACARCQVGRIFAAGEPQNRAGGRRHQSEDGQTGMPSGNSPCLGSRWGEEYSANPALSGIHRDGCAGA